MQRYGAYKDSGVEWIGEIPAGWEVAKFGLYSTVHSGIAFRGVMSEEKQVPIFGGGNVIGYSDVSNVASPALIVGRVGGNEPSYFDCSIWATDNALVIDTSIDKKYAYYSLLSADLSSMATSTSQPLLTGSKVRSLRVPVPASCEQRAIADYLDEKTAEIDTIVSQTERSIELLREYRKSVISEAITKGLDPDAPMKDSGIEWIGEIPDTCRIIPLKHLVDTVESGKSIDGAHYPASKDEIGILTLSAVFQGVFRKSENKAILPKDNDKVSCKLRKGSLLISRCNTSDWVGTAAYVSEDHENLYLPDKLWQLRFKSDYLTRFIQFSLSSKPSRSYFERVSVGASPTMQNISKKDLLDVPIVVFPNDGIAGIVRFLDTKTAQIDSLIETKQRQVELLKEYRKSLISEAVTGKFKVPGLE